jgi:DNA-binding NarL/FixJ family response regulator
VLTLHRAHELEADPPQAVVAALDFAQSGAASAVRLLHRGIPEARIVVVASDPTGRVARDALNAGAQAFVSESDAAASLGPAIRAAVAGLV